jgi:hypothetical protein
MFLEQRRHAGSYFKLSSPGRAGSGFGRISLAAAGFHPGGRLFVFGDHPARKFVGARSCTAAKSGQARSDWNCKPVSPGGNRSAPVEFDCGDAVLFSNVTPVKPTG